MKSASWWWFSNTFQLWSSIKKRALVGLFALEPTISFYNNLLWSFIIQTKCVAHPFDKVSKTSWIFYIFFKCCALCVGNTSKTFFEIFHSLPLALIHLKKEMSSHHDDGKRRKINLNKLLIYLSKNKGINFFFLSPSLSLPHVLSRVRGG